MDEENASVPLPDLKLLFNIMTVYIHTKECYICFNDCSCFVKLPCNHEFCENCMYTWFCILKNSSCPSCRLCVVQQEVHQHETVDVIGDLRIPNMLIRRFVILIPCIGLFVVILLVSLPLK